MTEKMAKEKNNSLRDHGGHRKWEVGMSYDGLVGGSGADLGESAVLSETAICVVIVRGRSEFAAWFFVVGARLYDVVMWTSGGTT